MKPTLFYAPGTHTLISWFGQGIGELFGPGTPQELVNLSAGAGMSFPVPDLNGGSINWNNDLDNDPFPKLLDPTLWNYQYVDFPDAMIPMNDSVNAGVATLIAQINATPGQFALGGYSQGAIVTGRVMTQILSSSRASDLIAGVTFGSPIRGGGTWPGALWNGAFDIPNSSSGGHGALPASQRIASPSWYWEFTQAGDVITAVGDSLVGQLWTALGGLLMGLNSPMDWAAIATALGWGLIHGQELLNAVSACGGTGHTSYPFFPPTGYPAGSETSYQIAARYLNSVAAQSATTGVPWTAVPAS